MRKLLLTLAFLFLFTGCNTSTVQPTPSGEGDALITKEYIDENIYNFYLDLSNLGLTKIPDFSEIATAVQKEDILYLNLSNNQIAEISDDLLVLTNLKELKLDNNQITKLENIQDILMLSKIDAYKNQISEIDLGSLPGLSSLDLSYNNLESDDLAQISKISSLESLQVQHNQIDSLDGIDALKNLKTLKAESNQIKDTAILEKMENLETVTLGYNPLSEKVIQQWQDFNEENKAGE